ncbi:hypothetical protein [Fortiea contorta]|uniref:hypothetical protein n=1 Tax=Fortiea contorta TaxID=1892405 RepID=UPI000345BB02|nr:hypothetical protein [Fortiea contorta]
MSSGASGRYQSKLFNFVHQQSRRLTQQWEHTFRHVQVATKWGIEVLLYPVYLLLQSTQSTTQQPQIAEPQSRLQLEPETTPAADTPIQQVLEAIKNLPSASPPATTSPPFSPWGFFQSLWQKFSGRPSIVKSHPSPLLTVADKSSGSLNTSPSETSLQINHLVVQGIATSLVNRHLVLVTTDNAILDILTPQQQETLAEKIITAIANYWRAWRQVETKQAAASLPEIHRLLAKLTGSNSPNIPALPPGMVTGETKSHKILPFLDAVIAKLESNALVPVQQHSQEMIQVAHTQLSIFLYGREQLIARGQIAVSADGLETHPLNIQALIAAALNYFFGVKNNQNLPSANTHTKIENKRLLKSRQLHEENLDPWLTWGDLFGDTKTPTPKPTAPQERKNPALVSSSSAVVALPKNLTGNYQSKSALVKEKKSTRNLTSQQKISQKVTAAKEIVSRISQAGTENHPGEIAQKQHPTAQMKYQPDWIEIKATHIGYDKHILEQVLELLDSAMLWLEEILVKIFQWIQQLWRGK